MEDKRKVNSLGTGKKFDERYKGEGKATMRREGKGYWGGGESETFKKIQTEDDKGMKIDGRKSNNSRKK